jgi:hypothetical protein
MPRCTESYGWFGRKKFGKHAIGWGVRGLHPGAVDASQALAENTTWYKACTPDNISTAELIQKFIAFVDANPKYTLASTAVQMMLVQQYKCKK